MRKRGSVIKICALVFSLLTLSAMSSCPQDRGQSGSANQGSGTGGGSSGSGGGY
jgi:hypothetical protein